MKRTSRTYDFAIENGLDIYCGRECVRCGNDQRRTKNKSCIVCNKKEKRDLFVEGPQCCSCGTTIKYIRNGRCVKCVKARYRRQVLEGKR